MIQRPVAVIMNEETVKLCHKISQMVEGQKKGISDITRMQSWNGAQLMTYCVRQAGYDR